MRHLNLQRKHTVPKIVFSKTATSQLIEQAQYIYEQTQNVSLADNYLDTMKKFIQETLLNFPRSGRPTPELATDTRKLVYQGFSIIYKISQEQIEILTIFRENLPKL